MTDLKEDENENSTLLDDLQKQNETIAADKSELERLLADEKRSTAKVLHNWKTYKNNMKL